MVELSTRYVEFQRENELYELFVTTNDFTIIKANRPIANDDGSWWMALGRYLKSVRTKPISHLDSFLQALLNEPLPITRALLLILKQCVYLFPDQLHSFTFQRHLTNALISMTDPYLKYKYVRLLRLILNQIEKEYLNGILPSNDTLIQYYDQCDKSMMLVLEQLVLIQSNVQLQISLNKLYPTSLIDYFQSNDFDDDEIIDLTSILFQINRNPSLQCTHSMGQILLSLFVYIDFDPETMINWLLTPETGEEFLILILRLVKYFFAQQKQIETDVEKNQYDRILHTLKRFEEQLRHASEKSLFPYNIKPLLNAFHR